MPRIAVTGHMNLSPSTVDIVVNAIKKNLDQYPKEDLIGLSCIARGADSVFAEAVLALGVRLEVILPSADYRQDRVESDHAEQFDRLLSRAASVRVMPFVPTVRPMKLRMPF